MNNTNFEWQTAEEEDLSSPPAPTSSRRGRKRLWLLIGFILLIGVVTLLAVRYFSQQQRQLAETMRRDVQASFNLWRWAAQQHDSELYAHLLATENRGWQRSQQRLFMKDLILGRSFLSLSLKNGEFAAPQVTLSPDWQQATVTFEQGYAAESTHDPARLQLTAVFELQDANWLQTVPDEEFWGDWATIEGDLLVTHFPARDAELARRIAQKLESDLRAICAGQDVTEDTTDDKCAQFKPFVFTMSTAVESLDLLQEPAGSLLPGASFEMPAPTLAGLPMDEPSYQLFYQGYTKRLLGHVRTAVNSPIPLPDQTLRTLCFDYPHFGSRLYYYDPALGTWQVEFPNRSFDFLISLGENQGIILDEMGDFGDQWNTRLVHIRQDSEKLLLVESLYAPSYRVMNSPNDAGPHLLLHRTTQDRKNARYRTLDLRTCNEGGCEIGELPGYTTWSPQGGQTLIRTASEIFLGDEDGQNRVFLGEGFNPMWLDEETAAYVQFVPQDQRVITALVMNHVASSTEQVIFDSNDLAEAAGIEGDVLFIKNVIPHPVDPDQLFVHASGLGDYSGEYFIFTVRVPDNRQQNDEAGIQLQLQREGYLGGDAGHFGPTGLLPFLPSPDGRWLLVSELKGYNSATRTFLLHDLHRSQTKIISEGEPVFPAQFPSYDWSADGRWLVIAGNRYFRMIAPEYEYEQLLPHEFDYCEFIRWSD